MPKGTEVQLKLPAPGEQIPVQNVESPQKVDEIFREAAKTIEEAQKEPPAEEPPAPKPKEKPKQKAKEPEPAPEPIKEPPPEPKKSKRELFKEKADAEKAYRDKESKLKEREAALLKRDDELKALEAAFREFQADPISYLDKTDPKAYEKWTERNLQGGHKRENPELAELRKKIEDLQKAQEEKLTTFEKTAQQAQYAQYMNEAKGHLAKPDYKDAQEDAEIWEKFTGQPVDVDRAIAGVYAEYKTQYNKELTPADVCEIINEDAQAHIENIGSFIEYMAEKKPDIFTKSQVISALFRSAGKSKKPAPPPGKTLTNEQETSSAPAQSVDLSQIKSKDQLLAEAAKLLEYAEEE